MIMDETLNGISEKVKNFAVIYLVRCMFTFLILIYAYSRTYLDGVGGYNRDAGF